MEDAKTGKQKVKEITDRLEEGLKELFESEKYKSRKRVRLQVLEHGRRILNTM